MLVVKSHSVSNLNLNRPTLEEEQQALMKGKGIGRHVLRTFHTAAIRPPVDCTYFLWSYKIGGSSEQYLSHNVGRTNRGWHAIYRWRLRSLLWVRHIAASTVSKVYRSDNPTTAKASIHKAPQIPYITVIKPSLVSHQLQYTSLCTAKSNPRHYRHWIIHPIITITLFYLLASTCCNLNYHRF